MLHQLYSLFMGKFSNSMLMDQTYLFLEISNERFFFFFVVLEMIILVISLSKYQHLLNDDSASMFFLYWLINHSWTKRFLRTKSLSCIRFGREFESSKQLLMIMTNWTISSSYSIIDYSDVMMVINALKNSSLVERVTIGENFSLYNNVRSATSFKYVIDAKLNTNINRFPSIHRYTSAINFFFFFLWSRNSEERKRAGHCPTMRRRSVNEFFACNVCTDSETSVP